MIERLASTLDEVHAVDLAHEIVLVAGSDPPSLPGIAQRLLEIEWLRLVSDPDVERWTASRWRTLFDDDRLSRAVERNDADFLAFDVAEVDAQVARAAIAPIAFDKIP